MNHQDLYLDIETLNAIPPDRDLLKMQFGIAVTHYQNEWHFFKPADITALWLQMCSARKIIGFNILDFDLPIIARAAGILHADHRAMFNAWPVLDLFHEIRYATTRWYKLDDLAFANLGTKKTGHGLQAVEWLQDWQKTGNEEPLVKAMNYCQDDVQLVIDLHAILLDGKPLKLPAQPNRNRHTELSFQLPKENAPA